MSAPRRRILFVEDGPELRSAYDRFFAGRYTMAFAASGAEAMPQLEAFAPDVVVLDLQLPDTDGIEILREIRACRPVLPVIITTAYASMQPVVDVMGMGHSGFLLKPYSLTELAERIDAAR